MKSRTLECITYPTARLLSPVKLRVARLQLLLIVLLSLGLCSCAVKRLRTDFVGFERIYAETSNREVLLNLARLQNRDPTYFFKIGQITSSYKMQASVTGNGTYAVGNA